MPQSFRPGKTAHLSDSVHQRLNMYALAANTAGVGMLALVQPAEAKIVYTPTHLTIGYGGVQRYQLDLNRDGVVDLSFGTLHNSCTTECTAHLWASFPKGNAIKGKPAGTFGSLLYVSALPRGTKIGVARLQSRCPILCTMAAVNTFSGTHFGGDWVNVKDRYVGLRFEIHGKSHFGWARLSVRVHTPHITATLTGYAYETIPGKAIIAGKTKGPDVTPVQPASLGALAAGANGLRTWRQK
jgi:hypothetical protein